RRKEGDAVTADAWDVHAAGRRGECEPRRSDATRDLYRSGSERTAWSDRREGARTARAAPRRREWTSRGRRAEVQGPGGAGRGHDRNAIGRVRRLQADRPDGRLLNRVC